MAFPLHLDTAATTLSSVLLLNSEKHLNYSAWLMFSSPLSVFGIDVKSPDPTQPEPLHFHRGFACVQSPVSWKVEFAIKMSRPKNVFIYKYPTNWLSFIHHFLVVTFVYLLPWSQILWGNRNEEMRNYCRGLRRGKLLLNFFVCQVDLCKAHRHGGWIILLNEFGNAEGYPALTLRYLKLASWNGALPNQCSCFFFVFLIALVIRLVNHGTTPYPVFHSNTKKRKL